MIPVASILNGKMYRFDINKVLITPAIIADKLILSVFMMAVADAAVVEKSFNASARVGGLVKVIPRVISKTGLKLNTLSP